MTRSPLSIAALLVALACGARGEEREVTTQDGVTLHVQLHGPATGDPVVLLHGLGSSAELNWVRPRVVAALVEHGLRVVAPDQRGHGRSQTPRDGAYGARLVDDVVAVLDALSLPEAHVVGYSMGGMVALALAARHPDRVRSVVLGGMGWLREGSRLQDFIGRLGAQREGATSSPAACLRDLAELAVDEPALRAISAPVTVIVGDRDPCRALYVRPLERARPDWPVHVIAGAGHLTCVVEREFREQVVAAVTR